MNLRCALALTGLMLGSLALLPAAARAEALYQVSLNTSPLINEQSGPFSLDFILTDGSGTGDGNNTVTLSNFQFGSGGVTNDVMNEEGGVTGDTSSTLTLTDSSASDNEFQQSLDPGTTLSFDMSLTGNADIGATPDQFSFLVLDNTDTAIPTLDSAGEDVLLRATLAPGGPAFATYPSDSTLPPDAGGLPITLPAPLVTAIPEPGPLPLFSMGLMLLGLAGRRLGRRRACPSQS